MFEKKKKKRGELSSFAKFLLALVAVLLTTVIVMTAYVTIFPAYDPAPVYPAPPEKVFITIFGSVVDGGGKRVTYRNMYIQGRFDTVGFVELDGAQLTQFGSFLGIFDAQHPSSGCVRGVIEIESGVWQDFEFGLGNIEWGAGLGIHVVVSETSMAVTAVTKPTRIKPALAPDPVIFDKCTPE